VTLSEQARERLADVVRLQPTKNAELQERWEMDSGSEVHQYLESELRDYYFRDENSLIRATPEAAELVGERPGVEEDDAGTTVRVPRLQVHLVEVVPDPDAEPASVVNVLHRLRDAGHDAEVDDVRSGLRALVDKGVVEVVRKEVPTFRLALDRDRLAVEPLEE